MQEPAGDPPRDGAASRARRLAFAWSGMTVWVVSLTLTLVVAARYDLDPFNELGIVWLLAILGFAVTGGLVAQSRPGHVIGQLFVWTAILSGVPFATVALPLGPLADSTAAPWVETIGTALNTATIVALIPLTALLFPDGRLPSRRWRWVAVALPAVAVVGATATLLVGGWGGSADQAVNLSPFYDEFGGIGEALSAIFFPLLSALMVAAGVSLVVRFRRSGGIERKQLLLLAVAGGYGIGIVATVIAVQGTLDVGTNDVATYAVASALGIIPVAAGVAILRHRLYDIDVVISRSVTFGVLAAFITGIYVLIVVGVGSLIERDGEPDIALSIAATALVAVAFEPVRSRVHGWANRLVFGQRATPYEVLSGLTARLAEVDSSEAALDRLARLIADGTGAVRTAVWLRVGDRVRRAASVPAESEGPRDVRVDGEELPVLPGELVVPVRHGDVLLGALTATKPTNDSVTPADERLLRDAAAGAALLLQKMKLNTELAERAEQLRRSRRRLVAELDGARRQMERDLHDGAQQEVVALKIKLGLARTLATRAGREGLLAEIDGMVAEADRTVDAMRTIARGIYPPLLESEGLEAAIRAATERSEIPVTLTAAGLGRYDRALEATTYFCVLEAVRNAVEHADATRIDVELHDLGGELGFVVGDDGHGFDQAHDTGGAGLVHMHDRVDALGGHLTVASTPAGTTVSGRLPVVSEPTPARIGTSS